jgi:hypothetical protein
VTGAPHRSWTMPEVNEEAVDDGDSDFESESAGEPRGEQQQRSHSGHTLSKCMTLRGIGRSISIRRHVTDASACPTQ